MKYEMGGPSGAPISPIGFGTSLPRQPGIANSHVLDYLLAKPFNALFSIYIFLTVALPSGSIYGFNFKTPLYLFLLPSAAYIFILSRAKSLLRDTALLIATPAIFSLWLILSQFYAVPFGGALRQYMDILITLMTCWLAVLFARNTQRGMIRLLRLIVSAEIAASTFKLLLLSYAVARGIPISQMVTQVDTVFGVELMQTDLSDLLGRIQFVSDGLIPVCIFAVLAFRNRLKLNSRIASAFVILMMFSTVLSFSRYIWTFTLLALLLGLALGKKDRLFAWTLITLVLTGAILTPILVNLFSARFAGDAVEESDQVRVEQIAALKTFFSDAPLFGHGLGSYTTQVIRDSTDSKYGYEVQLLALAGQVGLVGILVFAAYLAYYFRAIVPRRKEQVAERGAAFFLLLVWLAAGLFNPLLLTSTAGVSYAAILCVGTIGRKEHPSAVRQTTRPKLA